MTRMNRREFTQSILGGSVVACAPLPAMTQPSAGLRRGAYTFAVAIAHAKSRISPEMIVSRLWISTGDARRLILRLAANGVVTAPDATGVSALTPSLLRVSSQLVGRVPGGGIAVIGKASNPLPAEVKKIVKRVVLTGEEAGPAETIHPDRQTTPSDDGPVPPEASAAAHSTE